MNETQDIEKLKAEIQSAVWAHEEAMQDYYEFKVEHAESGLAKDVHYHAKIYSLVEKLGLARYVLSELCAPEIGCTCKFCGASADDPKAEYFVCDECLDEIKAN